MPDKKKISSMREETITYMNQLLPVKESFDIMQRDVYIGGRVATFYFGDYYARIQFYASDRRV